jgi:hypothetical protein
LHQFIRPDWHAKWAFLPVFLRDILAPRRKGLLLASTTQALFGVIASGMLRWAKKTPLGTGI